MQRTRMITLAVVVTCLALPSAQIRATLIYNSGGSVDVSTPQTDVGSQIRVEVSGGTILNWLAGADYSPTANFVSTVDEFAFRLADTAVLNLAGGNLTATDSDTGVGLAMLGNLPGNFVGAINLSGGTLNITESGTGAAQGFLLGTNGLAPLTLSSSGGSLTLTESAGGNARIFDISGGSRINATISGGAYTLNEAGGGTAKFFHIGGAATVANVVVTGGSFVMNEADAGDAYVFDLGSVQSELWIRGGSFSGTVSTNLVDAGAVFLFGTFGIPDGVYTDANWIDGTVVGGTLELGGSLAGAPTTVDATGRLYINTIPEPSILGLSVLGFASLLALRRRA